MKFTYVCTGVTTADDGTFPRVSVLVQAAQDAVPRTLSFPKVEITVPLAAHRLGEPIHSIAAGAVQFARQLLNEQQLADWVTSQAAPPQR